MNKRHYKVIFSRVLNQLVVVSELAKSQGKAQSENVSSEQEKTGLLSSTLSLNPIHFSLMLALGFVFLSPSVHAEDMAIRADKSAPGNQQPTVLQTGNGLPQVNIQTPSAGGVSRNQYSQFDVAEKGAVLNNARKAAQTQMAGWVQGNPNLARGEAKVILNEVNSANPSRLKGYVEVAGKKADVVIANPSGIQCDGCGVINAGRTTLTTGKAEVENGELKGYRVKGGKVTVGQKGMDNSQSDYTDIIAEKAEIKGGVWSKKGIKVTTGKNNVDRTNDSVVYVGDKNTDNTDRTSDTQGENQSYSVDVSQLGGMYAEKIHLVDNGQGLGVRNAGHIGASAGSVKIDSQGKIVNEGFIGGSENAELNAKKNIENRGTVYAKAQTQLNAQNIDNKQGVIAGKQVQLNANNVDNRKQSDKGSLIVASEKVSIKAKNLDNSGTKSNGQNEQGIKATALELQADNVMNQQGGIYVAQKADISLTDKLVNQQGEILSDGELHIKGDKNTASIDNNEGRVHAGEKLAITAKKLENEGQISSTGDADIALKDSFTLNKAFQVDGHLQFSTDGKFTNKTQLRTGQGVTVKAAEIDNPTGSEIASQVTHIVTSQLTNRGLIDGVKNRIDAESLNNLGTGRLYGNHLSIASKNLTNDKEGDSSATIAARERLDLGVDKMKNLDHSLVLSLGDLAIGGQLDEQGKAVGKAGEVFNGSATIEALGDGKINTAKLLNTDLHLTLGVDTSYEGFTEYALHKDSTRYRTGPKGVGEIDWNRKSRNAWFNFNDGRPRLNQDDWHKWEYTRTTKTDRIDSQDPGKILIGGNLSLSGDDLKNQYSKLLVGKTLYLGDSAVSANPNHKDLVAGATKLINEDKIGEIHRVDDGKYGQLLSYRDKNPVRRRYGHKTEWQEDYHHEHATEYFNFNVVKNNIGDLAAVKEASSQSTIGARNEAEAVGAVNNAVRLPNASLYKINQDPQSHYVVETDPQFADKRTWLSSDYMFNALKNDPQNLLKRLGDGYYEQRLINEQINQLTGKRFLDGYDNDYAQYKTLMDNGVLYAKKWQLVPGVALTEAQMKELTSDLVWFEKQETVLPNGQKVSVLAPKVYLAPRNVKVNGEGAIISANKVVINGIQQVENSGTILGNEGVSINAENITNDKGRVQGDVVLLQAENTLKNIGGVIEGKDAILAQAKKVQIEGSVSETQDDGKFHQKTIGKAAEINLTNKEGEVQIYADEDITVKGAKANIAGDAVFNAKGKLELGALDTHNKEHYGSGDKYYRLDQEKQVGNQLNVGGNVKYIGGEKVSIVGNDLHADGNTLIASKGDIEIKEGRNKEQLSSGVKTVDKSLIKKETRIIKHDHNYDTSKGSDVSGKDVVIYSQNANATIQGSSVNAKDGLLVQAKNINVKEAEDHTYAEDHYERKRSGLVGSVKGGVAKFGYEKSKFNLDTKSISSEATGSQLTSGAATLVAENVLTVRGSDLNSQEQFDLHAKQVNLEAAKEVHHTEVHQSSKTSGFGLSMVYDPTVKAVDQYKQRQKQGGTETVVGKINSIAEAGADSVELMSRGIVPYLEHKRSKSDKTTVETTAKVTALNAGGQLNVVASEGDIRTQGTQIAAEKGATFLASNNIELGTAENTYTQQANTSDKGFSLGGANKYLFGVHTQRENGDATQTQEVSTTISVGGNNQIVAQTGDIHAKGAKIVSEGKNQLSAGGNVVLDTAVTTQETTQQRKGHAVGEAVISDSERFYGYNRTRFNQDGNFTHHEKAQLASLGDKVEVYAGKDYRQTSAEILSKDKASINAQNIIVDSAFNTDKYKQSESDLKFGQFTRVKSPIIDLINSIESTIKNKNASDRVQAANIMSVAAQAYNLASAFQGQGGATYLLRVESGTGVAHSRKKEDSYQHTSQGNLFNAKEIEFTARGDGSTNAQGNPKLGNINITHADITSVDEKGNRLKDSSVTFNANNLTIDPGKSTVDQHARSQSAGVEVGMAATIGAQTGIGIYARVGGSSSKTNVEGVNYTNSHLNTETLNINTQGDTTLTGTTAKAKTINANVGGNLNIASVQDENKFETKSSGGGIEAEIGIGTNWNVSGYGNSEKGESSYKQVKEQAGLFAEEGGYHVNAKNVHLKGAAITSTNPENSELSTNKLTFEDIQNESHSDASSMSFSASVDGKGSNVNTPNVSGGLPMKESNSDDSVTRATLTEGKITLNKDTAPMQTTAQALGINTDINQANGQVDTPKDVNQILSEQRQISAAVGNIKSAVNTYVTKQKAPLLQEIERLEGEKKELEARQDTAGVNAISQQLDIARMEAAKWEAGGSHRRVTDALTSTIVAALSGQSVQGIAVTAASPFANALIKEQTIDKETGKVNLVANTVAHALWGAVEANALGGSGTSGALAAGVAELSAPVVGRLTQIINEVASDKSKPSMKDKMNAIVDKIKTIDKGMDPSELSNKDKEMLVGITSFIGQVVAQATSKARGADSDSASKNGNIGKIIAKNAVENNALKKPSGDYYLSRIRAAKSKEERDRILREMATKGVELSKITESICYRDNKACAKEINELQKTVNDYVLELSKPQNHYLTYTAEGKAILTMIQSAKHDIQMAKNIMAEKEKYKLHKNLEPFSGSSQVYKDGKIMKGVWGDGRFAAGLNEPPPDYVTLQLGKYTASTPLYGDFKYYEGVSGGINNEGKITSNRGISLRFGELVNVKEDEDLKRMGVYRPSTKYVPEKRAEMINNALPGHSKSTTVCATIVCVSKVKTAPDEKGNVTHMIEYGISFPPTVVSVEEGVGYTKAPK